MAKRDYYEVLEVPKTATADEIKKAYRKKPSSTTLTRTPVTKRPRRNSRRLPRHTAYLAIPTREPSMTSSVLTD